MLYTRYHDGNAGSAEQTDRLENWFSIVCLVVFGLRDMRAMRNAGGKMSPKKSSHCINVFVSWTVCLRAYSPVREVNRVLAHQEPYD